MTSAWADSASRPCRRPPAALLPLPLLLLRLLLLLIPALPLLSTPTVYARPSATTTTSASSDPPAPSPPGPPVPALLGSVGSVAGGDSGNSSGGAGWPPPAPSNSTDPRPELDPAVDMLMCFARTPRQCHAVTAVNMTAICTRPHTILISDRRACFAAAKDRAGYRPEDLATRTGGEILFCRSLLSALHRIGYSYLISKRVDKTEECLRMGQAVDIHHITFIHDNWPAFASDHALMGARKVRPPLREECLFTMTFWGTKLPSHVWPGDLRYYISVWPNGHNTHVMVEKPAHCPVYKGFQQVPLPPYGVLFGKYKVMPWKINLTAPFSHDPEFWTELRKRVHIVVLDCSDELAARMGWGSDYRQHFTCWKDSPLSQQIRYHNLMMGASFYLGLGDTLHSPTPIEVLYCRTPIIMPPYQHALFNASVFNGEFYPVNSGEDVLRAVETILGSCRVQFTPVGPPADHMVLKNSTCFRDPHSLDAVMSEESTADRIQKVIHARQILCSNKLHHSPLNVTLNGTIYGFNTSGPPPSTGGEEGGGGGGGEGGGGGVVHGLSLLSGTAGPGTVLGAARARARGRKLGDRVLDVVEGVAENWEAERAADEILAAALARLGGAWGP